MIIGRMLCDICGKDCTRLWGFILGTRGIVRDKQQQEILGDAKKEFGKSEFVFCWSCTAKAFGVKTLAEQEAEEAKPDLPVPKEPTLITEQDETNPKSNRKEGKQ